MSLPAFVAGGLGWMASEYLIHRYIGHGPKRARPARLVDRISLAGLAAEFNREHLAHHSDPSYFAPTSRKLLATSLAAPAMTAALAPFVGLRRAAAFTAGFVVVYGAYEVMHRRIHTHAPRGAYARWMRRHHLLHHHKTPRQNHGVTTPIGDFIAGTYLVPEKVRVPRHVAPKWLVDPATGEVRAAYAEDYELVGRRAPAPQPAAAS